VKLPLTEMPFLGRRRMARAYDLGPAPEHGSDWEPVHTGLLSYFRGQILRKLALYRT
jgi:hypothetical protein